MMDGTAFIPEEFSTLQIPRPKVRNSGDIVYSALPGTHPVMPLRGPIEMSLIHVLTKVGFAR